MQHIYFNGITHLSCTHARVLIQSHVADVSVMMTLRVQVVRKYARWRCKRSHSRQRVRLTND